MTSRIKLPGLLFIILIAMSCETDSGFSDPNYSSTYPGNFEEGALVGDRYNELQENPFVLVKDAPVSTFSIDADGGSYSNVRRFIMEENQKPPNGAIRTEEFINYFDLNYTYQQSSHPISLNGEVSECPWKEGNKLIRIGIKGKTISLSELPPSNFVLLIDVSGSMSSPDKLELLKEGFNFFVDELRDVDRVAIVTYAGSAGVVLESTPGSEKQKIKNAINSLGSGGSTAGAQGIVTSYDIAEAYFVEGGNNRIVMGTDGDFNVGISSQEDLIDLIEQKRDSGIFLTVLGVGRGNLNDGALEQIANHGNGTYEYLDKVEQLKKVFIYDFNKFYTVAKDVKVQIDFNPDLVEAYRLIGYENRLLETEDFEDDEKDAGEIGADQNITALYEIIPKTSSILRTTPVFTIDFRYKLPKADSSIPLKLEVFDEGVAFESASESMIFAGSIISFTMLLRNSDYKGTSNYSDIIKWIDLSKSHDPYNFKQEFRSIVSKAEGM